MPDSPGGFSLVNLGELSRPATVLIEKISDAVGGIAKPWQTRRTARAEAEADIIRAQARVEISEIEERALQRMVREEGKKQENIENITAKAIAGLSPGAKPDQVEDDWIAHFFDRARLISSEEMQSLWAKMLAGEANKPGSFGRKTVEAVATLDRRDADTFTKFCSLVWQIGDLCPVILDAQSDVINNLGINFINLTHLDDVGLITFQSLGGFSRNRLPKRITVAYYDRLLGIEFEKDTDNLLNIGHVLLTKVGQELAPICGSAPSEEYYMDVIARWSGLGYALCSPVVGGG